MSDGDLPDDVVRLVIVAAARADAKTIRSMDGTCRRWRRFLYAEKSLMCTVLREERKRRRIADATDVVAALAEDVRGSWASGSSVTERCRIMVHLLGYEIGDYVTADAIRHALPDIREDGRWMRDCLDRRYYYDVRLRARTLRRFDLSLDIFDFPKNYSYKKVKRQQYRDKMRSRRAVNPTFRKKSDFNLRDWLGWEQGDSMFLYKRYVP